MRWAGVLVAITLVACGDETGSAPANPDVPDGHPCPELALPANAFDLYRSHIDSGEPVPLPLLLPFDEGLVTTVSQGRSSEPTHQGPQAYAWDFAVPEGTAVHASAPGVVVWVKDDSEIHGPEEELASAANWIAVDHGAGLYSVYVHLAFDSAQVEPGDTVAAGTHLAHTGLSGQLSGPNLHFHVENVWSETVPARFIDDDGCGHDPLEGEEMERAQGLREVLVGPEEPSLLPFSTFAHAGVLRIEGLPGRLLSRSEAYPFRGKVEAGFTSVALMIFAETGGEVVLGMSLPAEGGTFEGDLNLGSLAPGRYGWAMVATAGEVPGSEIAIWLTIMD